MQSQTDQPELIEPQQASDFYLLPNKLLFESAQIDGEAAKFMQVLVSGNNQLFKLYLSIWEHELLLRSNDIFYLLHNSKSSEQIGNRVYTRYGNEYINVFKQLLVKDCPEMLLAADQLKFRESDLSNFVHHYNLCLNTDQHSEIIAERRPIGNQYALGFNWSHRSVVDFFYKESQVYFMFGLSFKVRYQNQAGIARHSSFVSGISISFDNGNPGPYFTISQNDFYDPRYMKITIPVYYQYEFMLGNVRPYINLGLNFQYISEKERTYKGEIRDFVETVRNTQEIIWFDPGFYAGIRLGRFDISAGASFFDHLSLNATYVFKGYTR